MPVRHNRLLELTIHNFKSIRKLHVVFNPDGTTTISGPNEQGKTTIMNAYLWIMAGIDVNGKSNTEIKPLDESGNSEPRVKPTVEAVFRTPEGELTLRREFVEKWGPVSDEDPTEEFKENTTDYFIDDLGVKKAAFDKKIAEMVSPTVFKIITNQEFFLSMPQKEMREQIINLVGGDIDNEALLATKPEYDKLVNALKTKPIEVFLEELQKKVKLAEDQKKTIKPRLDENNLAISQIPAKEEYPVFKAELEKKRAAMAEIDQSLVAGDDNEEAKAIVKLKNDLILAKGELSDFEKKTEKERQDKKDAFGNKISLIKTNIRSVSADLESRKTLKDNKKKEVAELEKEKAALVTKYTDLYNKPFVAPKLPEEGEPMPKCEFCGRSFTMEDLLDKGEELEANYNKEKADELRKITEAGQRKSAEIKAATALLEGYDKDIADAEGALAAANETLAVLSAENETYNAALAPVNELPEYAAILKKCDDIQYDIDNRPVKEVAEGENPLVAQKAALQVEIDALIEKVGKETVLDSLTARIQGILNEEGTINSQIVLTKKSLNLAMSFMKDKSALIEQLVNERFEVVKFSLFSYNNDGTQKLACFPTVKGVPFNGVNTAAETQAFVDVVNVFSEHHGLTMPLFLDKQESVNEIPETSSQVIRIFVTEKGTDLKIE